MFAAASTWESLRPRSKLSDFDDSDQPFQRIPISRSDRSRSAGVIAPLDASGDLNVRGFGQA
jgi:hypothetical protein